MSSVDLASVELGVLCAFVLKALTTEDTKWRRVKPKSSSSWFGEDARRPTLFLIPGSNRGRPSLD